MARIYYNLEFKGAVAPAKGKKNVMLANGSADSNAMKTTVGPHGVRGTVTKAKGGEARFESQVTMTGKDNFQEKGKITFGVRGKHGFTFDTVGAGTMGSSHEKGTMHGSVMWRIVRGFGQFKGAKGLITSNFFVDAKGRLTDRQVGQFFTKGR
jgi:hypothetical protein